jgi:hypothetical protein
VGIHDACRGVAEGVDHRVEPGDDNALPRHNLKESVRC